MTANQASFSFPSYRRLCRYLGETDAMVELTELAARSFLASARQSGNISAFVSAASAEHGICVNLAEVDRLSNHLARNYIVTVYQSAERFLNEFRKEHIGLYQKEWTGDGMDVDPLTVTLKNIALNTKDAEEKVGSDLISRFQYLRIVRNWIVHTKDTDINKPLAKYAEIVEYSSENQDVFGPAQLPHTPVNLDFDDFIFFSRLTKILAEKICIVSKPPLEYWVESISLTRFKKLQNNPDRMLNAICGSLRTEYGMDDATAGWIAAELMTH